MGGNLYVGTSTDSYVTSTPAALTILNNGNVGIGTAAPGSYKLYVNGNSYINGTISSGSIYGSGGLQLSTNPGAEIQQFILMAHTGEASVGTGETIDFQQYTLSGTQRVTSRIGGVITDVTDSNTYAGDLVFYTAKNAAATEKLRITSAGNVGIGTTTPNWNLQIASSTKTRLALSDMSAAVDNKHWFMSSMGGNFYIGTSSDALSATTTYLSITNATSTFNSGLSAKYLSITGTSASSTFANGIELTAGCFRDSTGSCVGGGGGTISGTGVAGDLAYWTDTTVLAATSTLAVNKGGTGSSTLYGILKGIGTGMVQSVSGTTGEIAFWSDATTLGSSSTLAVNVGGTGVGSFTQNGLLYGNGTGVIQVTAAGVYGQLLIGNTSAAPSWAATSTLGLLGSSTVSSLTNNYIPKWSSTGVFANSLFYDAGTNIGLGTTTPAKLLNIATNAGPQLLLTEPGASTDLKHWYASTTAGSLTFGTLTDSLTTLTERLRIDSNGRLGIGTTTPNSLLHIAGATPKLTISDTGAGANLKHWFIQSIGGYLRIGTTSDALVDTTATYPFSINSSNGYIGIGTSSPQTLLHLGTASTTQITSPSRSLMVSGELEVQESAYLGPLRFAPDGGALSWIDMSVSGGTMATGTIESYTARLAGTDILTIYGEAVGYLGGVTNTKVGVGTTTPYGILSVYASSTYPAFIVQATSTGGIVGPIASFYGGATELIRIDNQGRLGIGTTTPNWNLQIASSTKTRLALSDISASANLKHWLISSMGGNFYVSTSSDALATSTIPALMVDSNGRVGIGTSSPSHLLSLNGLLYASGPGTSTLTNGLNVGAINQTGSASSTFANGIQLTAGCFRDSTGSCVGGGGTGTINSGTINRLSYYSAATTLDSANFLSVVTATNRFGIGTDTPMASLSIHAGTGSTTLAIGSTTMYMLIDSSGNVGMGTSTPNSLLHIASTANTRLTLSDTDATLKHWFIESNNSFFSIGTTSDSLLTSVTRALTINSSGYLGIGSTTPTQKISTDGLMYIGGAAGTSTITANLNIQGQLQIGTGSMYLDSAGIWLSSGNMSLQKNGGNVGIGTTSPLTKLSIQGTAGANDLLNIASSTGASMLYINSVGSVGIGTNSLSNSKFKIALDTSSVSDTYDDQSKISSIGNNTLSAGKLQLVEAVCGAYNVTGQDGLTYGTVTGEDGKCWLDRNLGAIQLPTAYGNGTGYGSLYQWGRLYDGHQATTSSVILGTSVVTTATAVSAPYTTYFVATTTGNYDWLNQQNNDLWQGVNGTNNPCPSGFRLPTQAEWDAWTIAAGIKTCTGTPTDCRQAAYATSLKLPTAGYRSRADGSLDSQGSYGYYWSSSPDYTNAYTLFFNSGGVNPAGSNYRAHGFSVRCLKD